MTLSLPCFYCCCCCCCCSLSRVWLFETPWTAAHQASLSFSISQSLLKLMSKESVMPSNHLVLCHTLLLPLIVRVFSDELALRIRWPKYWSFSFSISPLINIQGWFPLGWLVWSCSPRDSPKSLLQHHSSKASICQHSAFFMVQLTHPYLTTGKTIALTRSTFVEKWCFCFLICCVGLS